MKAWIRPLLLTFTSHIKQETILLWPELIRFCTYGSCFVILFWISLPKAQLRVWWPCRTNVLRDPHQMDKFQTIDTINDMEFIRKNIWANFIWISGLFSFDFPKVDHVFGLSTSYFNMFGLKRFICQKDTWWNSSNGLTLYYLLFILV